MPYFSFSLNQNRITCIHSKMEQGREGPSLPQTGRQIKWISRYLRLWTSKIMVRNTIMLWYFPKVGKVQVAETYKSTCPVGIGFLKNVLCQQHCVAILILECEKLLMLYFVLGDGFIPLKPLDLWEMRSSIKSSFYLILSTLWVFLCKVLLIKRKQSILSSTVEHENEEGSLIRLIQTYVPLIPIGRAIKQSPNPTRTAQREKEQKPPMLYLSMD